YLFVGLSISSTVTSCRVFLSRISIKEDFSSSSGSSSTTGASRWRRELLHFLPLLFGKYLCRLCRRNSMKRGESHAQEFQLPALRDKRVPITERAYPQAS